MLECSLPLTLHISCPTAIIVCIPKAVAQRSTGPRLLFLLGFSSKRKSDGVTASSFILSSQVTINDASRLLQKAATKTMLGHFSLRSSVRCISRHNRSYAVQRIEWMNADGISTSLLPGKLSMRRSFQIQSPRLFSTVSGEVFPTESNNAIHIENSSQNEEEDHRFRRPWLDRKCALAERVRRLAEADYVPPGDFMDKTIVSLVDACCRRQNLKGMQMAHSILDRLMVEKRRLRDEKLLVTIPIKLLDTILYGWASQASSVKVARRRMAELVMLATQEAIDDDRAFVEVATGKAQGTLASRQETIPLSRPTTDFYNTYLRGLANAAKGLSYSTDECEHVLNEMEQLTKDYGWHTKPNSKSYTIAISAVGNSESSDSGKKAVKVLRRMQEVHDKEAVKYLEEYGVPYDTKDPDRNKRRIVTADTIAYTAAMTAVIKSNSKESNSEALGLLQELMESTDDLVDPRTFSVAINSFVETADTAKDPRKRLKAAQKAEEVFWRMLDYVAVTTEEGLDEASKNTLEHGVLFAFNSCLNVWSKSYVTEAAPHCEGLLNKVIAEDILSPDTVSFNICLHGK